MDFDLFRTQGMDNECLHRALAAAGTYETLLETAGSLTVLAAGVKLSFFQVSAPFLFTPIPYLAVAVADVRDIALMKLVAIANRGSRKDFIDLYTTRRSVSPSNPDSTATLRPWPRRGATPEPRLPGPLPARISTNPAALSVPAADAPALPPRHRHW